MMVLYLFLSSIEHLNNNYSFLKFKLKGWAEKTF